MGEVWSNEYLKSIGQGHDNINNICYALDLYNTLNEPKIESKPEQKQTKEYFFLLTSIMIHFTHFTSLL